MLMADNTIFSCADYLEILGASTTCSLKVLFRHVIGELYLYLCLGDDRLNSLPGRFTPEK